MSDLLVQKGGPLHTDLQAERGAPVGDGDVVDGLDGVALGAAEVGKLGKVVRSLEERCYMAKGGSG